MIEPVRYEHKEIDLEIFKSFFDECGGISKFDNDTEISPIWKKIYEDWIGSEVISFIENQDIDNLKKVYEEYYVHGLSEGASSGKALVDNGKQYRLDKAKRNVDRVNPLRLHFQYNHPLKYNQNPK